MNVLDLFSGIGGFSLGLERAGMRTVAFCEIEPYARRVLAKNWPDVPCYTDVRELGADRLARDGISVDVMCGGFPCQDISVAGIPNGTQVGISGARSGLWKEYWRLIGELRPRFAIMENTAALVSQGLGTVLGDLSRIGYDAEWHSLAAGELGAPHNRARVWVVAYPMRERLEGGVQTGNAAGEGLAWGASAQRHISQLACGQIRNHWQDIPDVCGVADGVSERVDRHWAKRIKCLGNTVVPQVVEEIGRAIMAASRGE